jgi:hypothetical protein
MWISRWMQVVIGFIIPKKKKKKKIHDGGGVRMRLVDFDILNFGKSLIRMWKCEIMGNSLEFPWGHENAPIGEWKNGPFMHIVNSSTPLLASGH